MHACSLLKKPIWTANFYLKMLAAFNFTALLKSKVKSSNAKTSELIKNLR